MFNEPSEAVGGGIMRYLWAALACSALATPAYAADQLQYGPAPSWVIPQQMPPAAPASADAPFDFLLSDTQAKLEPGMMASYSHFAIRINNPQGLAIGNFTATWDPAFDDVTIHRIALHRGDKIIDVLSGGQKPTILRRERNLEQQTLNGQLTAALQPEGLQVGDVVEFAMTLIHRDPTLRDHMELKGGLGAGVRIGLANMRLITPGKSAVRVRSARGLVEPTVTQKGGEKISTWTITPLIPEQAPAFAPDRYAASRTLDVSDFRSWGELASLFLPLFEKASEISAASPLQSELARIKAASADPLVRAELALQLVEEKIRYVNLALGVGGLVPASADQSWERRFGDCKAKSAMLVGLLRGLGIEAVPVLVHSDDGDGLNERLPMVELFNHVVVRATIAGKTYWLDGTRSGDSKLAALEVPFYHWGLPIARNSDLVGIVPDPASRPYFDTVIRTDASAGAAKAVPTTIDMTLRGDVAIAQNLYLTGLDAGLRDEAVRKQIQQELDRFEVEKISTSYDRSAQIFKIHGEGRQTLDVNKGIYWSEVPSLGYKADFRRSGMRDADAPVQIPYPTYSRNVQTIVLPKDRVSRITFQTAPTSETVAGVEYRRTVTNGGGVLTIEATRRAIKPEISFAEAVAAENRLRALDKDDIWIRVSDSTPVRSAEVKGLIGHDAKTSNDYFQAAMKLLKDEEGAKAIGALDKAIELAPSNASAHELRAQLKLSAGDLEGAKADARAAIKADNRNSSMHRLLADIYRRSEDLEGAYAEAAALAKIDTGWAQTSSGHIFAALGKTAEALASYNRALSYESDPMTYAYRADALAPSDRAGRKKELEAALKLNPSDAPALVALARLAGQLGEYDRALQLLDQAFLKSPDDVNIRHARAIALYQANKADAAKREFDALSAKDLSAEELNSLCWTKALANVSLDRALDECNRSLAKDDSFAAHDSKAIVFLRQSRFDDAITEFDMAMKSGDVAASLYGRALAYARKGDQAKSNADVARAVKIAPGIERTYAHYGLTR